MSFTRHYFYITSYKLYNQLLIKHQSVIWQFKRAIEATEYLPGRKRLNDPNNLVDVVSHKNSELKHYVVSKCGMSMYNKLYYIIMNVSRSNLR